MTVPYERTIAVLNTQKFLRELLDPAKTPRVPKKVRNTARWLLRHYPSPMELEIAHKARPDWWGPVPPFPPFQEQFCEVDDRLKIATKNGD